MGTVLCHATPKWFWHPTPECFPHHTAVVKAPLVNKSPPQTTGCYWEAFEALVYLKMCSLVLNMDLTEFLCIPCVFPATTVFSFKKEVKAFTKSVGKSMLLLFGGNAKLSIAPGGVSKAGTEMSPTARGWVVARAGLAMLTSSPGSGEQVAVVSKQMQNQLLLYFSSGKSFLT